MNIVKLNAKLRAAQAELAIRTRTYNGAKRALDKVVSHIKDLEAKVVNLEKTTVKPD